MQSDSGKLRTVAECTCETQNKPLPAVAPLRGSRSSHKSSAGYAVSRHSTDRACRDNPIAPEHYCCDLDMGHCCHYR